MWPDIRNSSKIAPPEGSYLRKAMSLLSFRQVAESNPIALFMQQILPWLETNPDWGEHWRAW
jgi:hypothetical protein